MLALRVSVLVSILLAFSVAGTLNVASAYTTPTNTLTDLLYTPAAPAALQFAQCVNGGTIVGDHCVCPIYYTEANCSGRQCPNSAGGDGPYHILPINPSTKRCDHCDAENFDGMNCQLCQRDAACRAYAGEESSCNQSLAIRGSSKQFQCTLDSPYFVRLMGDGRNITAQILLNCSTPDGGAFGEKSDGTCNMAIYRIEPDGEYVDPFFRCATSGCTMHYGEVESEHDGEGKSEKVFRAVRVAGQVVLITLCALLACLGGFTRVLGPKRTRQVTLLLSSAVVVCVVAYIAIMAFSMRSVDPQRTIIYECKHTSCSCAEDPPRKYQPICSESEILSKNILPSIQNSIRFTCDATGSNTCKLTLTDLALVFAAECRASECVNEADFPLTPPGEDGGSAFLSEKIIECALLSTILLLGAAIAAHWVYARRRSRERGEEFKAIFHLASRAAPSSVHEPNTPERPPDVDEDAPAAVADDEAERQQLLPQRLSFASSDGLATGSAGAAVGRASLLPRAAVLSPGEVKRVRASVRSPLELSVVHLEYTLAGSRLAAREDASSRMILNQINFSVSSGTVLAIMGPSGAGKTTLLDLLSARAKSGTVSGHISLNGTPLLDSKALMEQYRGIIGYVSQEDTLLPGLTVHQTIEYAARLKLPQAFSPKTIRRIVARVVTALGLQRCEHTLIGDGSGMRGISGGERRRVSIAVELLANPRILFLDEPTSGLDTVSAKRVVEAVVELAKEPAMRAYAPHYFSFRPIVIFSIHQPSQEIYELFDQVLLLSRGVSVYCGPACDATAKLEKRVNQAFGNTRAIPRREDDHNPAEYLMKLEATLDDNVRAELQEEELRCSLNDAAAEEEGPTVIFPDRFPLRRLQREEESNVARSNEASPSPSRVVTQSHGSSSPQRASVGSAVEGDGEGDACADGGTILQTTSGFRVYYANVYQQMGLLTSRAITCLLSSFHLVVCHAAVVACLATLMCALYRGQALDLPGALNRAGCVSFLLLVTAFVSLSCLEQLVVERKLFMVERENGFYSTLPYLVSKVVVDIIPLRIVPAVVLSSVIYFPMGFRVDSGVHFFWFIFIIAVFSVCMTLLILCVGIVSKSFGSAALLSSVLILWNFVFGGAMVQSQTIPAALKPFKVFSPVFLAFESLMVNELNGQACTFSPTDETGKQSSASIPIMCVQYLSNAGLTPSHFNVDVAQLTFYCFAFLLLAWVLLATCAKFVR